MRNITAISGERVQIDCPYSGFPIESVSWEKGAVKLPQNHRQIVFPNGTLLIKKIERPVDEDLYRCVASAPSAKSQSQHPDAQHAASHGADVHVRVIVAPLISPFAAAPNLREGMRSMLTCSVLDGDPPFTFTWLKDDVPIEMGSTPNVNIAASNKFSSTLFINKVSYQDNGNFTCSVKNTAASTNYTINMLVKGNLPSSLANCTRAALARSLH